MIIQVCPSFFLLYIFLNFIRLEEYSTKNRPRKAVRPYRRPEKWTVSVWKESGRVQNVYEKPLRGFRTENMDFDGIAANMV